MKNQSVIKHIEEGIHLQPDSNSQVFSKDYVNYLNEAGWRLEKKLPSNSNHYSDLLEDIDWETNQLTRNTLKHYRRDLDALS